MQSRKMNNKLIIAAAGSGKTTFLVEEALKQKEGKVLITTYTQANEAEIRKKIGKKEGDSVHVTLYSQELPTVVPEDFLLCLQDEPVAYQKFQQLSESEQQNMMDWIYSARRDEQKVERIAQTLDKLLSQK